MTNIQNEILQISSHHKDSVEISNIERLTDRDISKLENDVKKKPLYFDNEGKRTRGGGRRSTVTVAQFCSSGQLKNFQRPYSIKNVNSGKRTSLSRNSLTQRSGKSSPHVSGGDYGFNTTRDYMYNEYNDGHFGSLNQRQSDRHNESNPEHFQSKQGISDSQILNYKNMNSTFGMKKQKPIESKLQRVSPSMKIQETIGGIQIDKSLYTQDHTKITLQNVTKIHSSEQKRNNSKSSKKGEELPTVTAWQKDFHEVMENTIKVKEPADRAIDLPFTPLTNLNQYMQYQVNPQFDIIKEEVQNENIVSSFDNSQGFDLSTPKIPGLNGAGSCSGVSGNPASVMNYNSNNTTQQRDKKQYIIANAHHVAKDSKQ